MPVLALAGPIAAALGASATTAGVIGAGAGVLGAVLSEKDQQEAQNKATDAATQASTVNQVDLNALNQTVQDQAKSNIALGNQLEQQYNPYINSLRQQSAASLGQYVGQQPYETALQNVLYGQIGNVNQGPVAASPLFTSAANAAQQQLNLGGALDQETQNQIMRAGLAKGGTFAGAGGNLGLGRDIAARDLGLTSLQLQNQRMQNAANIGSTQQNYGLQAQNNQINQLLGLSSLANQVSGQQFNRDYTLANFTQGIQQPQVGLSPSTVAGVVTGNANMVNSANQNAAAIQSQQAQSNANQAGQNMGYGLSAIQSALNAFAPATSYSSSGSYNLSPSSYVANSLQSGIF